MTILIMCKFTNMNKPGFGCFLVVFGLTAFFIKVSEAQPALVTNPGQGPQDAAAILAATIEKNKELELQNQKLKQLWSGLQQMCAAFSAPKECVCPQPSVVPEPSIPEPQPKIPIPQPQPKVVIPQPIKPHRKPPVFPPRTSTVVVPPVPTTTPTPPGEEIQPVLHMVYTSGLLLSGKINVTVEYTAPMDSTTEWLIVRNNGGTIRAEGSKRPGRNNGSYKSEMFISHTNITTTIIFRVHSTHDSVGVRLDPAELEVMGSYPIAALNLDIAFPSDRIIAPLNDNLTLTLAIRGDIASIAYSEIVLTGLNTTNTPPMVFEAFGYAGQAPDNAISIRPKSVNLTHLVIEITINNDYSKYGGVLSAKFSSDTTGLIRGVLHGVSAHVLSRLSARLATVPPDEIGVFPMRKTTIVYHPDQSLMCAAMGNPRPEVSIVKIFPDNTKAEMPSDIIIRDDYTYIKTFTLSSDNPEYMKGKYLCRASTPTKVISTITDVQMYESPAFDLLTTGLTKRRDKTIITCKASGRPQPYMELREQDEYGPLLESPQYNVVRTQPDERTSVLQLHLSPTDKAVFPVYCAATQNNGQIRVHHRVDAFRKRP